MLAVGDELSLFGVELDEFAKILIVIGNQRIHILALIVKELTAHGFNLMAVKSLISLMVFYYQVLEYEVLVVYDGHTDKPELEGATPDADGNVLIKMKGHKSAVALDLTNARNLINSF